MKKKEGKIKKEIDISNISVSFLPTIALIVIFALAFTANVFGEFYIGNGANLVTEIEGIADTGVLCLSYSGWDLLITFLAGIIISFWNFSFLLNKNLARAVLLQAKKRSDIFNKKGFLPLIMLASIVIIIKIIALSLNLKYASLTNGYIAPFIADMLVSLTTLFWGFMCGSVGAILPKGKLEAILGAFSLALLPTAVMCIINYTSTVFLRGYTFDDFYNFYNLTLFDPLRESYAYTIHTYFIPPFKVPVNSLIHSALWISVSAICLILLKRYFIKNYKFENCGIVNKNKCITFVSSFVLPVALSANITTLLFNNLNPYANVINIMTNERNNSYFVRMTPHESYILLAVFAGMAIIFSVLFNMISTVKISNLKEKIKPVVAIVGMIIISSVLCLTGGLGYENNLPDKEEIKQVVIEAPYDLVENTHELVGTSDYFDINTAVMRKGITFDDAKDFKTILDIHSVIISDKSKETTESIKISYELKDGSRIERYYGCIGKTSAEEILRLWNTNKIKNLYKAMLTGEGVTENDEFKYTFLGKNISSMDGVVYIQSKDGKLTSITDVLSDKEIKELKEMIYKDVSSLAYFEWFKPTESYGLLKFNEKEIENKDQNLISTYGTVSFQITKDMINTVNFLKSHDLMKFFENTKQPVKVFIAGANELGEYYSDFIKDIDSYYGNYEYYPLKHRMMFASETSVSKQLYIKDAEPMFDINENWITELTAEECKECIEKAHIKYFSGGDGTLLIVAYPESNCAQAFILS